MFTETRIIHFQRPGEDGDMLTEMAGSGIQPEAPVTPEQFGEKLTEMFFKDQPESVQDALAAAFTEATKKKNIDTTALTAEIVDPEIKTPEDLLKQSEALGTLIKELMEAARQAIENQPQQKPVEETSRGIYGRVKATLTDILNNRAIIGHKTRLGDVAAPLIAAAAVYSVFTPEGDIPQEVRDVAAMLADPNNQLPQQ